MVNVDFSSRRPSAVEASVSYLLYASLGSAPTTASQQGPSGYNGPWAPWGGHRNRGAGSLQLGWGIPNAAALISTGPSCSSHTCVHTCACRGYSWALEEGLEGQH